MKPFFVQSAVLALSLSISLINTVPLLPTSSFGYFYTHPVLAVLVPVKGRGGTWDPGPGVHLLGVGFVRGGSGAGACLGLSQSKSSSQRLAVLLFPNMGFFQDFQFCRILNTQVLGNLEKTHAPFLL